MSLLHCEIHSYNCILALVPLIRTVRILTSLTSIVCLLALALSGSYVKIFIFTLWNSVTPAYTNHTYTHHIAYSRKLTSFCSVQDGFDSFAVCHRFVTVLIVPDRHLFTSLTLSVSLWWNHIPIISSLADPGRCTARWEVSEWVREFVGRQDLVMLQLFFTYSTPAIHWTVHFRAATLQPMMTCLTSRSSEHTENSDSNFCLLMGMFHVDISCIILLGLIIYLHTIYPIWVIFETFLPSLGSHGIQTWRQAISGKALIV